MRRRKELRNSPSARDVRACLPEARQARSLVKGLGLFLSSSLLYATVLLAFVAFPGWPAKLLCSLLLGSLLAVLYFVAHDACHGSLTPSRALNRLIGRLAFLPTLHPYSLWVVSHNQLHHGFTNLRGKDYVWAPLSKEEFDRLSPARRLLERLYHTRFGVGLYYLIELWWKHLACPRKTDWARVRSRRTAALDLLTVVGFVGVQGAGLCAWQGFLTRNFGLTPTPPPLLCLVGLLVPWLFLNWMAGLVTFVQHTHPRVRWFADREEWCFYRGQVRGTVHITVPWPVGLLLHNVLDHTAHHADPRVPLYQLGDCQRHLERAYPDVVMERWTPRQFRRTLATCRLYDYKHHRWLDFAGNATTGCIP